MFKKLQGYKGSDVPQLTVTTKESDNIVTLFQVRLLLKFILTPCWNLLPVLLTCRIFYLLVLLSLEWRRRRRGGGWWRRRGAAGERSSQCRPARRQNQSECGWMFVCASVVLNMWLVICVLICHLDTVSITKRVNVFVLYQLLGKVSIHCFF